MTKRFPPLIEEHVGREDRDGEQEGGEREGGEVFVQCPLMVAMSKAILRSRDSVTNIIIVERKGSEIINLKSIVPVTEYVLKVGFN